MGYLGNSLVVQWLGLCTFTAKGLDSNPGWETKIPQAVWHGQRKGGDIFSVLGGALKLRILCLAKIAFKYESKIKTSANK